MLRRRPDWQARLAAFLTTNEHRPFVYGEWDCCLWVCSAIEEMTGVDPAAGYRGRYRTRSEAYQVMRETIDKRSLRPAVEAITAAHGMPQVPVLSAQRGDVVLIKRPDDYSLALVGLTGALVVLRARNLCFIPRTNALLAWRV